jgi:tRNA(Met) C34 N-acetyltransferase TmcA
VAIDEAAAIPLPTVKKLMGNYLVFMSSTVNGYEGTAHLLFLIFFYAFLAGLKVNNFCCYLSKHYH